MPIVLSSSGLAISDVRGFQRVGVGDPQEGLFSYAKRLGRIADRFFSDMRQFAGQSAVPGGATIDCVDRAVLFGLWGSSPECTFESRGCSTSPNQN
jgi:hypothetical protein